MKPSEIKTRLRLAVLLLLVAMGLLVYLLKGGA